MMVAKLNERSRSIFDALLGAIWAECRAHGLRDSTLAARLGLDTGSVSDWRERDAPTVAHAISWAAVVGLRLELEGGPAVDVPAVDVSPGPELVACELSLLAKVLRLKRVVAGRTQGSVAASLGVAETTVRRWEKGLRVPYLVLHVAWSADLGCSMRARAAG